MADRRSRGSTILPAEGEVLTLRASGSVRIAFHSAFMSPRTPLPLSLNLVATRATYAGLGLLVTSRWIICWAMNGPTFGLLNSVSSAILRSAGVSGLVVAGIVVPQKTFSLIEW